jgi:hypothetical protein
MSWERYERHTPNPSEESTYGYLTGILNGVFSVYKTAATPLQSDTICTNDTARLFLKLHAEAMRLPTAATKHRVGEFLFSVSLLGFRSLWRKSLDLPLS